MKRALPAATISSLVFSLSLFVGVVAVHAESNQPGAYGLTAVSGPGEGQATIAWTQNSPLTEGFDVLYGTSSKNYVYGLLNIAPPGVGGRREVTIGSLVPGQNYYFVVAAKGGDFRGYSNEAMTNGGSTAMHIAGKPMWTSTATGASMVTATAGSKSGTVGVSWKQDVVDISSYSILYGTEPGRYVHALRDLSAQGLGGTKTVTIGALNPGQTYYFAVQPAGPGLLLLAGPASAAAAK